MSTDEKSNYYYVVLDPKAPDAQPVGDVEAGYRYQEPPSPNRRRWVKLRRFFVFGLFTYALVSIFVRYVSPNFKCLSNAINHTQEKYNHWHDMWHKGKGHHFELPHHPHHNRPHHHGIPHPAEEMTLFNANKFMLDIGQCDATIPIDDLPTYHFDAKATPDVHIVMDGAILSNIAIVSSDSSEAEFKPHVWVSDDDLVSKIEVHKIEVDDKKVRFVVKAPRYSGKGECAVAKAELSIPSDVEKLGALSISFAGGSLSVDENVAKNVRFDSFHAGSVMGFYNLPTINADKVVIDNALGGIDAGLKIGSSAVVRSIKGDINVEIKLDNGNKEEIVVDNVMGSIKAVISENFVGKFKVSSVSGGSSVEDEGKDGHLHFDSDHPHFKKGLHFTGSKFKDGKGRISVNNVRGDSSVTFN